MTKYLLKGIALTVVLIAFVSVLVGAGLLIDKFVGHVAAVIYAFLFIAGIVTYTIYVHEQEEEDD